MVKTNSPQITADYTVMTHHLWRESKTISLHQTFPALSKKRLQTTFNLKGRPRGRVVHWRSRKTFYSCRDPQKDRPFTNIHFLKYVNAYPGHSKGPSDWRRFDVTEPWMLRRRSIIRERCKFGDPTQPILLALVLPLFCMYVLVCTWSLGCLAAYCCTDKNDIDYLVKKKVVRCFLGTLSSECTSSS